MDYQSFSGERRPSIKIRILVVDDDWTSLSYAASTLMSWKYEVLTAKHPFEALSTLRQLRGQVDLVVSDYHMPDMNGVQLLKKIHEEFKIPVIMMSIDKREFVMIESMRGGAVFFMIKPIKSELVENVWQSIVSGNKGKSPSVVIEEIGSTSLGGVNRATNHEFPDTRPVPFNITSCNDRKNNKHQNNKIMWTNALHTLFLQAINQIGLEKAFPKKILSMMNVQGLTRQHVASHLQKYRIFLRRVAERNLGKFNDLEKAMNDAFALTMASNAQYHEIFLSMPPTQLAAISQPKFGSSSSAIGVGKNQSGTYFSKGETSSSGLHKPNHGSNELPPLTPSATGRATLKAPMPANHPSLHNANVLSLPSRGSFQQENQFPTRLGLDSMSPNPNNNCNNQTSLNKHGNGHQFPTHLGLDSMSSNPNNNCNQNATNGNQNGLRMHQNEPQFPTRLGLNSMSPNPNTSCNNQTGLSKHGNGHQFPTRLGLNSMSPNPNSSCNNHIGLSKHENGHQFPTRIGLNSMSPNPNNNCNSQTSINKHENGHQFPTRLGLNSMIPNPSNNCNNQNGLSEHKNGHQFPARLGLKSMSPNPNSSDINQIGLTKHVNERVFPTRLGLNSMSPNPINSFNNQVPSRLGLSNDNKSYKPNNGCDVMFNESRGALVLDEGMNNPFGPKTSGHGYITQGEPSSFEFNILNSTLVTNKVHENGASKDGEIISSYVLDELAPTLVGGEFDGLDLLELFSPQGNGDIDIALEAAQPPLDQPTTNASEDQNMVDDFIDSLLVDDDVPYYMEADQTYSVPP